MNLLYKNFKEAMPRYDDRSLRVVCYYEDVHLWHSTPVHVRRSASRDNEVSVL